MDEAMWSKAVFIQMQDNRHLDDLNHDLKYLEANGYRYVFIDEVTLLEGMKGDFHIRFCEKFGVKLLLLTRLRGRENLFNYPSYSISCLHKLY